MPLPAQVRNLLEPQSLEGLSVGTMLLALLGNALMVPRALFVQDVVWLSGTTWACVAGWGQLFSMFHSVSATTGYGDLQNYSSYRWVLWDGETMESVGRGRFTSKTGGMRAFAKFACASIWLSREQFGRAKRCRRVRAGPRTQSRGRWWSW